jgi:hypothetical protein
MASWQGNPKNPTPNPVQEDISRSEKRVDENRSFPVRRDTDKQKNNVITLMDVDRVIFDHLERMQITVVDEGNIIKVPIFYGSPEKWVAARRDGCIRDRQGKIQLPALIFRRTNLENDDNMEMFNRYIKYPVIQKHSIKNQYTQFSILTQGNAPVNEVFNITMADHMIFTYSFIVWTEYHEQMNPIIEKIKFNTKDYWGTTGGFRFRTRAEAFSHTIELNSDDDRLVRTEFNLITNGYILPESYQLLDRQYPTTDKFFTPKKIIIGTETVADDYDMSQLNNNADKWKSKLYPNINMGEEPKGPGITWEDAGNATSLPISAVNVLRSLQVVNTIAGYEFASTTSSNVMWQKAPSFPDSPGTDGWMAHDASYLYIYTGGSWKRVPINQFS